MDKLEQAREALTPGSVWERKPQIVTISPSADGNVVYVFDGGSGEALREHFLEQFQPVAALSLPVEGVKGEPVAFVHARALRHHIETKAEQTGTVLHRTQGELYGEKDVPIYTAPLANPEAEARLRERVAEIERERDEAKKDHARDAATFLSRGAIIAQDANRIEELETALAAAEARLAQAERVAELEQENIRTSGLYIDAIAERDALKTRLAQAEQVPAVTEVRPLDEWHEDYGDAVWWTWQDGQWLGEPSYIGGPNDSDWPGYHTHWSPHPAFPAALHPQSAAGEEGKA